MKEDIDIIHVNTEQQPADIFTKPLDDKRFCKLRCELNILDPQMSCDQAHILTLMHVDDLDVQHTK